MRRSLWHSQNEKKKYSLHSYLREGGSQRHNMILEQSKPIDELVADRGIVELNKLAPSALAGKNCHQNWAVLLRWHSKVAKMSLCIRQGPIFPTILPQETQSRDPNQKKQVVDLVEKYSELNVSLQFGDLCAMKLALIHASSMYARQIS